MSYTFYSIGDASFLQKILSGVSAIVGSGNDFKTMLMIGLLLGFLLMMLQSLVSGARDIQWPQMFVAWLVYAIAFAPQANVTIEDVYTQKVYTVGKVPLGIAFTGELVTTLGFKVTRMFEQAYSTPGMTQNGWSNSLDTLMRLRTTSLDRSGLGAANRVKGGNFYLSWVNYIADCTTTNMTLNKGTFDEIINTKGFMKNLRYDSENFRTEIKVGSQFENLTCTNAWKSLTRYTEYDFLPAYKSKVLAHVLRIKGTPSAAAVTSSVQRAIDNLGLGVTANEVIMTSVLDPIFNEGVAQRYDNDLAHSYATMIEDAMRQRAVQWTAESSLFETMVQPLLTFIEGFIFAVIPLAAFLMMLGSMGIRLAGKYLLMLFWIQLWMPVLSIINLYVHSAAAKSLTALGSGVGSDTPLTSLTGLYQADHIIQSNLAMGGMLAATTPALSLMLVYGSAVTATHLSGRMQGGDFIGEKKDAPDTFSAAPRVQNAPLMVHDTAAGLRTQDADSKVETFSWNKSRGMQVTSASAESKTQSAQFGSALQQTMSHAFDDAHLSATQQAVKDGTLIGHGQAYDMMYGENRAAIKKMSSDTGISEDTLVQAAAGAALGFGSKGTEPFFYRLMKNLGIKIPDVSVDGKKSHGYKESSLEQFASSLEQKMSSSDSASAKFQESLAADISTSDQKTYLERLGEQTGTNLSKEARESYEARQSFEKAQSMSSQSGVSQNVKATEAVQAIASREGMREYLGEQVVRYKLGQQVNNIMGNHGMQLRRFYGGDEDRAVIHAQLRALNQSVKWGGEDFVEKQASLDGVLSGALGGGMIHRDVHAKQNKGITGGKTPSAGEVEGRVPHLDPDLAHPSVQDNVSNAFAENQKHIDDKQPERENFTGKHDEAKKVIFNSMEKDGFTEKLREQEDKSKENQDRTNYARNITKGWESMKSGILTGLESLMPDAPPLSSRAEGERISSQAGQTTPGDVTGRVPPLDTGLTSPAGPDRQVDNAAPSRTAPDAPPLSSRAEGERKE